MSSAFKSKSLIRRTDCVESMLSQNRIQVTQSAPFDASFLDAPSYEDGLPTPLITTPVYPTDHRMRQSRSKVKLSTKGYATIFSTMVNMFNLITGAGMLGVPYAFANSGVALGAVLFCIAGFGEAYAIHLLTKCVLKEHKYSFRALAKKTMKFKGNDHFVNTILAVHCFGSCCGYLIVCGGVFPDIVREFIQVPEDSFLLRPAFWVTFVVWVIAFPLVCLKTLDSLKFSSLLGFLGITYVSIITAMFAYGSQFVGDPCENKQSCPGDYHVGFPGDALNILRVTSIFCYAFVGTQNVPTLAFELKNRSVRRFDIAVFGAISISVLLYFLTAISGYKAFGDTVDADLLISFPINTYSSVARLGIAMVLCTSFPLQMYPTKNSVCNIIFGKDAYECSNVRYYVTIFMLLSVAWFVGIYTNDLSVILEFVGASTSIIIGFSFPAYFYIKCFAKKEGLTFDKFMSYFILTTSLILSPVLIGVKVYSLIYPHFEE